MPPFRTWALLAGTGVVAVVVAVAVSRLKLLAKVRVLARAVRLGAGGRQRIDQVEKVPPRPPGRG